VSLISALALAVSCLAASAQVQKDPLPDQPDPFADFISARCATPEPTVEEQLNASMAIRRWAEENGVQAVGGQIKVAFHVIYSGSEGNIPQSQIDAQIAELNKAYSGFYGGVNTGYTFVLASVSRTNSRQWFKMAPGSNAEKQAKQVAGHRRSASPQRVLLQAGTEPARLGVLPELVSRRRLAPWCRDPLRLGAGRLPVALQPRRHARPRGRPLPRPLPHVPGWL
jgi:hypothetical protein